MRGSPWRRYEQLIDYTFLPHDDLADLMPQERMRFLEIVDRLHVILVKRNRLFRRNVLDRWGGLGIGVGAHSEEN
jgi:hypothetical protein